MKIYNRIMICVIALYALGASAMTVHNIYKMRDRYAEKINAQQSTEEWWENTPTSGMFFSSEYVDEEYEYDDAHCIVYSDPDVNMVDCEIYVDLETYQRVIEAKKSGMEMVGQLVLNDDYTTTDIQVFTFMENPEMEMAEASAKRQVVNIDNLTLPYTK